MTIIVLCSIQNSPSSVLVFLKGWTLATLDKYPFCSSFQVDEWPGTTMGTSQPTTTSASAGTLKKHYILHSDRIVAAKH